jgi:probable phosphoglycerate mutase
MIRKTVYFVRHGESESNIKRVLQGQKISDGLSEKGFRQAQAVAERVSHLDFGALIASDLKRAEQTAETIAKATGHAVEYSELFREHRVPSSTVGEAYDSEKVLDFHRASKEHIENPDWRYEDEENFSELMDRVHKAIALLETHVEEKLLVVTHGHFLRVCIATMLMNKQLTPDTWLLMWDAMQTTNTGITVCRLGTTRWRLLTWNDHAHFAE